MNTAEVCKHVDQSRSISALEITQEIFISDFENLVFATAVYTGKGVQHVITV